ncbi:insulin receptor substrate 1 isoform X2 [Eurosta solidaginis]
MSIFNERNPDDGLILCGYQKKLNTMKKKFFVLYKDTMTEGARLEYFDSIKKFKSGTPPKRIVKLATCLNINRRFDTKHDFVIALAMKDGGLGIVLESEDEMIKWLQALLSLQRSTVNKQDTGFPTFDHVWQVVIQKKNLAEERKIIGSYHACLSSKCLTFIRIGSEKSSAGLIRATDIQIPLNTIRRCGDSHCLFYMEVGRQCAVGPGELWMETEDPLVAKSMHKIISSAMSTRAEAFEGIMRKRSLSVTETSKYTLESKHYNMNHPANNNPVRGRCDSFPSRIRETKDDFTSADAPSSSSSSLAHRSITLPLYNSISPIPSAFGSTEKRESAKLGDQEEIGNYLTFRFKSAERPIPEENSEDLLSSDNISCPNDEYTAMAPIVNSLDLTEYRKLQKGNQVDSRASLLTSELINEMHAILISADNQLYSVERPKRSYSIGSKIEQNKVKRFGISNDIFQDTNAVRVRAFSVGSRPKIPKCGLQHSVLFPKSYPNQSCISNNSLNFATDDTGFKFEWSSSSNKKSTSAPILIQNVRVPTDCMSDLMEIDFSKSTNHKTNKSAYCSETNSGIILNEFNSAITSPRLKSTGYDASGYLEMKPVESPNVYLGNCNDCLETSTTTNEINIKDIGSRNEKHSSGGVLKKSLPVRVMCNHSRSSEKMTGLSLICSNISKSTYPEMDVDSNQNCVICFADKKKTAMENMSWKKNSLKTTSSTDKKKNISFSEKKDLSSGKSCAEAHKRNVLGNSITDSKVIRTNKSTCSAISSNCCELYYAKLDLPQCSTKENKQLLKTDLSLNKAENDSYAKIDFDHSSDSSSSSKMITN